MDTYSRFLLAFVFVIGLIAFMAWLARRYGLGGAVVPSGGKRRRLRITEALPLDGKRRLVLVERDGVEHLLLLGVAGDTVVEHGIPARTPSFSDALETGAGSSRTQAP